jgi:hypothetical protein
MAKMASSSPPVAGRAISSPLTKWVFAVGIGVSRPFRACSGAIISVFEAMGVLAGVSAALR